MHICRMLQGFSHAVMGISGLSLFVAKKYLTAKLSIHFLVDGFLDGFLV